MLLLGIGIGTGSSRAIDAASSPTFTREIAPIAFQYCSPCHRPGQAAPFELLKYEDFAKRKEQILEVVSSRVMPPWLPESQRHRFLNERRLSEKEIELFQKWLTNGVPQGELKDLPAPPEWQDGWSLGKPDLVVTMAEPYNLTPDGPDIYRNFVIPIPNSEKRQVVGMELRPGNVKVVHHAFIRLDLNRKSRKRDIEDPDPGFSGLHAPDTIAPEGFFSSWQPGKVSSKYPQALSWTLLPGTDLVLQMHLRHSGKPEVLQAQVGFYFTPEKSGPPPIKFSLKNTKINIPAGATNYFVEDALQLPVDVDVIGILPHAHYLAKRVEAFAELPTKTSEQLLRILNWDFNWQGDYAYEKPVHIPAGSKLRMRVTYDNSTNNPANPSSPPKNVRYGLQSTDEMAEVWFQALVKNPQDYKTFNEVISKRLRLDILEYNEYVLQSNPNDPDAHTEIALVYMNDRKFPEAMSHLKSALQLNPNFALAHYQLGLLHRVQNRLPEAQREFETAVRLDPSDYKAHGNLGFILLKQGKIDEAEGHFETALQIHPEDELAIYALGEIKKARQRELK
jgi:tetratricopeptide (TPR) repeat protein